MPPRDSLKLFGIAIEALRESGVAAPGEHLAMIRSWNTTTLLISNRPLNERDIAAIRSFANSRSFDTAFYPGMPAVEANRFNVLDEAYLYQGATALLGPEADDFRRRYKFHIAPATDNRPYFFHFFKWDSLGEVLALRKRGGAGLIEWGYLVIVATLVQAVVAGGLLILLTTILAVTGVMLLFVFALLALERADVGHAEGVQQRGQRDALDAPHDPGGKARLAQQRRHRSPGQGPRGPRRGRGGGRLLRARGRRG